MVDVGTKELIAEGVLGQDAEDFIKSELGRYIIARVEQEREDAINELVTVSVWRRNRIKTLQNQVWRCDTFKSWLAETVLRGKQAVDLLEQRDS